MAIDLATPAASIAEYVGENNRSSSDKNIPLLNTLLTCTRWAESKAGLAPGMLLPQTALTYTFVVEVGGSLLQLRDEKGKQHLLVSSTAIGIDSEGDGTYDGYTLVLGTNLWVRGFPVNAVAGGEAFEALQLRPGVANAAPAYWQSGIEVRIAGNWGAPVASTVRLLWKQRVIQVAREMIDVHSAGPAMTLQDIDSSLPLSDGGRRLLTMMTNEAQFSIPAFA